MPCLNICRNCKGKQNIWYDSPNLLLTSNRFLIVSLLLFIKEANHSVSTNTTFSNGKYSSYKVRDDLAMFTEIKKWHNTTITLYLNCEVPH